MNFTSVLLYFLSLLLCAMVLKQGLSRSVDFLSCRNLYLFGFIVYQLVSPADALRTENFHGFNVVSPEQTGKIFLMYAYLFTGVFLLSYHKISLSRNLARKFSVPQRDIGDSFLLGFAVFLILVALPMRFVGPSIPWIGRASINSSIALAAVACAITGWVWGNRRLNLAVIAMMILIVGSSFVVGMTGAFGRRPLVSIVLGLAWGAYYRRARYMKPVNLVVMLSPILIFIVLVVSAFTAIRHSRDTAQARIQDTARNMASANVKAGSKDLFSGQSVGSAVLWAIESWPSKFETRPLFSLKFMVGWYIPRYFWPEKPAPLSTEIATLARLKYLNRDRITIPPGVIGYAVAEGGLIAVVIYALFFGQFLRFMDELIRTNILNPLIILPAGSATGHLLGLARGDIAVFTNLIILSFVASFAILILAFKFFGRNVQPTNWAQWPQYQ